MVFSKMVAILVLVLSLLSLGAEVSAFYNPIVQQGQDPSVKFYNGNYYLVQSSGPIKVYRASRLENLGSPDETVTVWSPTAPSGQELCCDIWAPELYFDEDNAIWYIYFAADNGDNVNHRSYALRSASSDPMGPYEFVGKMSPATDEWVIDSTVLTVNGQRYYVWSGWPSSTDQQQNLYIAALSSPTTFSTDRYLISVPENSWEIASNGVGINEGPTPLQKDDRTYLVYSASGSWDNSYCFGMLTYLGGDPLQQSSWSKSNGCVFAQDPSASVYGPGHNAFTVSPDGTETWNVYHADVQSGAGWDGRSIRAQKVNWNGDGTPNFGTPVSFSTWVDPPSGE